MALNYDKLKNYPPAESEHHYSDKDTMLYALGVGLGADPVDPHELRFVFEKDLLALPTMATILAARFPFLRDPDVGVDLKRMLHGESSLVLHRPVPPVGTVIGEVRVRDVIDHGPNHGASLYYTHEVHDKATLHPIATINGCFLLRGNGGFGGPPGPARPPHPMPERSPDLYGEQQTLPRTALIYRLSGDRNPVHADPDVAREARFERPILHGTCTYGMAGLAILKLVCGYDPARLKRLDARFGAPMYPGETLRTEIWKQEHGRVAFRCRAMERDVVVLGNGYAEIIE
jgi:acyl dehydratase